MMRLLSCWGVLLLAGSACSSGSAARTDAGRGADRPLAEEDVASTGGQVVVGGGGGGPAGQGGLSGAGGVASLGGAGGTSAGGTGGQAGSGGVDGGAGQSGAGGIGSTLDATAGGITGSGGQAPGMGGALGPGDARIDVHYDDPYPTCGTIEATLGGSATFASSTERHALTGDDCRKYVVWNNNFADPTGSTQTVSCVGTSFTVLASTCSAASTEPASFPSVYIGGNGNIANGAYLTWDDSGLPKQISAVMRAKTSFSWKGGLEGGDFAATVKVWLSKSKAVAGSYDDAISGSLAIWLGQPSHRQPVGERVREAMLEGHLFDVWVGPHGSTALGTDDPQRPVVSYVLKDATLSGLDFDLVAFLVDAVSQGSADQSAGKTSSALYGSWYVTDVFAGFQIWTGSDATGLTCKKFSCRVQ